ncbi:MAG: hypothetical protein U1F41_12430 [Burkholderiales bacterium]
MVQRVHPRELVAAPVEDVTLLAGHHDARIDAAAADFHAQRPVEAELAARLHVDVAPNRRN